MLLSLRGSLEDALRAHLLLHKNPLAHEAWPLLLAALRQHDQHEEAHTNSGASAVRCLAKTEARRALALTDLCEQVGAGDSVVLTQESALAYYQLAAELLPLYGVLVVAAEPRPSTAMMISSSQKGALLGVVARMRFRRRFYLLLIALLLLGAVGTTAAVVRSQFHPPQQSIFLSSSPPAGSESSAVVAPLAPTLAQPPRRGALAPGRRATVQVEADEGLALRVEPGSAITIPVRLYLDNGTVVAVVEGPVVADARAWWKVRAANQEGWCAGEFLKAR